MTYAIGNDATLGIACLGITHPHTSGRVKAFQRMPNAKVLGAYDASPLLDPFVEAMGIAKRTKEEILADPDVHAVLIHPKSYLMADWAIEAMEAGKAVLCEKPAGRGSVDTVRLVETVEKTGQLFQVGYCWRYAPSVDQMQEVLKAGQLGKVLQVRAHAGCSHGEADTDHMRQPGDIGGAFYVIGCHTIDRLLLHFGMPQSVNARITKFDGVMAPAAREDAAGAILNYADKMITIDFMSWDSAALDRKLGHHRLRHRRRDAFPSAARLLQALQHWQGRHPGRLDRMARDELPRDLGGSEDRLLARDRGDRQPGLLRPRGLRLRELPAHRRALERAGAAGA